VSMMRWADAPRGRPRLGADEVHLWLASAAELGVYIDVLRSVLTPMELARTDRFVRDCDRERAVMARGIARLLLASYLDFEPTALRIVLGRFGKPALCPAHHREPPAFNLSHSGDLLLVAIGRYGSTLGVDIERHSDIFDMREMANLVFDSDEISELASLPYSQRQTAFFDCWTRKEAIVKALGMGLSQPTSEFRVSLLPGQPVQLLSWLGRVDDLEPWSLQAVPHICGYSAALAVRGTRPNTIQYWRLAFDIA
jgi:4'-phosphopantetheinyl transferase